MRKALTVLAALSFAAPVAADEVEDALNAALEAWQAGDAALAAEEAAFAQQLMAQMKASDLGGFLPAAPEGWTREDGDTGAMPGLGGMMASARYTRADEDVEIQLMADNQMVASMMMMFSNPLMLGQMGEVRRIGRQKVVVTKQGELQAMLDNNVLVQISGEASIQDMEMFFGLIDFEGLKAF